MNSGMQSAPVSSSHTGMIVGAVALLIVGGIIGYVLAKSGSQSAEMVTSSPIVSQSVASDWKIYTSLNQGYELRYPSYLTITHPNDSIIKEKYTFFGIGEEIYLAVFVEKQTGNSVSGYFDDMGNIVRQQASTTIAGQPAIKVQTCEVGPPGNVCKDGKSATVEDVLSMPDGTVVFYKGDAYVFTRQTLSTELFNEVLATLKFTK